MSGYKIKTDFQKELKVGDKLEVYPKKVEGRNIYGTVEIISQSRTHKVLYELRALLIEKVNSFLSSPQSELVNGILLGDKSGLSAKLKDELIKTGTIHIVVVSGYNISLLAAAVLALTKFFNRRLVIMVAILAASFYTILTGAEPPTVRAAIMNIFALLAVFLGRQRLALYFLALAAYLMILVQPKVISAIGFQLSFLATLGIILFQEKLASFFNFLPKPFSEDLSATLAAQVLVIPLIAFYFGTVSLISPIVNMLVLWLVPLITIFGFLFLFLAFAVWPLAILISWGLWSLSWLFLAIIDLFAKFDFIYFTISQPPYWLLPFYYLLVFLFIYRKTISNLFLRRKR